MRTVAALLLCAALTAAACGGREDVYETSPGSVAHADDFSLPRAVPAAPAYILTSKNPLGADDLRKIEKTRGVAVAAAVGKKTVKVGAPGRRRHVTLGAVRPLEFRAVAPPSARDADFVWLSMLSGQAVVTFDAARRLGIEDASVLELPEVGSVAVGAFADNGAPDNVADVLVAAEGLAGKVVDDAHTVIIGAANGTVLERLGRALERRMPGARVRRLTDDTTASPLQSVPGGGAAARAPGGRAQGGLIGTMAFEILKDGFIRPDPAWVRSNISAGSVPVLGTITCHRAMFPQLRGVFTEIQQKGLDDLIRPGDYGGCFVPRFIDRDPAKPLSMHAFGLALDINVSTNGLGARGDLDPRIVGIFEKWGFEWGGRWSRPDPMHFELARLLSR